MYNIDFSDDGSNQRDKEEKTIYCFELFLQDLEEDLIPDLSLEDLLIFITGADAIPSLGFDDPIVISFHDKEVHVKRLPWSLRVCPQEDQADMTHPISPISLKLSQMIKVIKLFKCPK